MSEDAGFRRYLYPSNDERIAGLKGLDAYSYREAAKRDAFTGGLIRGWEPLYLNEFVGVTSDGTIIPDLYPLEPNGAPAEAMMNAAVAALATLTPLERETLQYSVDAVEWQSWANPEFMQHDTGLRLEFLEPRAREALLGLLDATLSARGAALAKKLMNINGYLGKLTGLDGIMNEFSYNMAIYGTPSLTEPWGWQIFGHHLALNCAIVNNQLVISPIFFGAEPDKLEVTDDPALMPRVSRARALMAALTPQQRDTAVLFEEMVDPAMPAGRIHPGDERHLAGAFQDNRVIPYEGLRVTELDSAARESLRALVHEFVDYLPEGPARARQQEIESHFDDTWISWIGGTGPDDVFYIRVQSPVVIFELDHHCGVFLKNSEPAPFHIHTIVRTPNGNDYGRALLRGYESSHE
ncbi:DUF3500 domain-containing protein [Salinibacterium sp. NK8237]|uniref:DUF3500 domain-containing protein n=1 Tax=Salinibacterium sp. NK8237 TaxID=2792038 RepID=UPI0018CF6733|nr:DUF3500 domain-containing protein [Salinibacterium sp. NK8237]MBH0130751.1 DUF3500 domain-containing protein [Salinibacterium sp. NK8237]